MKQPDESPPHNIENEIGLIASCIVGGEETVSEMQSYGVKEEWFYRTLHATLWKAMVAMAGRQEPINEITLADELNKTGNFEAMGGNKMLIDIVNRVETPTWVKRYAQAVADCYYRRRIIRASSEAHTLAKDPATDTESIMAKLSTEQDSIQAERHMLNTQGIYTAKEAATLAAATLQKIVETKGESGKGIPTGLVDLDKITHGLREEVIVLAARPGCGKTSLAMQIAQTTALRGIHTLFFSLEMSAEQLMKRVISSLAQVNLNKLMDGYASMDTQSKLAMAAKQAAGMNMTIDDQSGQSVGRIRARIKQMKRKHNTGLVVIDYLQLVKPNTRNLPREQQIAEIMDEMVIIKKECKVPVLILAQINREAERANRPPKLSDLRESDSIGANADVAMFLYNDMGSKECDPIPNKVFCLVDKNRNGPVGTCPLTFRKEYVTFANYIQ